MGTPSNNELDREVESPVDDAWSTAEPVATADADRTTIASGEEAIAPPTQVAAVAVEHDRTTIGTGEDRIEPAVEVSGRAVSEHDRTTAVVDHERTTVAVGADRAARKIVDDLFAEATEHDQTTVAAADDSPAATEHVAADGSPARAADHDRTTFGVGVATSTRKPIAFSVARPKLPDQKHDLVQPERSPLALVMGDLAASTGAPPAHDDSGRLVAALMGDELPAPEEVAEPESPITAIPPQLMARRRRRWIAAGALATVVVVGTVFAMRFRDTNRGDRQAVAPTPAPSPTMPATPTPPPPTPAIAQQPAPPAPQASETPAAKQPAPQDSETAPASVDVAIAAPARTVTKPSTKPAIAKKTVATAKRPSSTRKAAKPKAAAAATVKKKKRSFF